MNSLTFVLSVYVVGLVIGWVIGRFFSDSTAIGWAIGTATVIAYPYVRRLVKKLCKNQSKS